MMILWFRALANALNILARKFEHVTADFWSHRGDFLMFSRPKEPALSPGLPRPKAVNQTGLGNRIFPNRFASRQREAGETEAPFHRQV
jgi:hypothetical protein